MSAIAKALKIGQEIYICAKCAHAAGGVWPQEHVATWSAGNCAECKQDRSRAALSDWNWPGRKVGLDREL